MINKKGAFLGGGVDGARDLHWVSPLIPRVAKVGLLFFPCWGHCCPGYYNGDGVLFLLLSAHNMMRERLDLFCGEQDIYMCISLAFSRLDSSMAVVVLFGCC